MLQLIKDFGVRRSDEGFEGFVSVEPGPLRAVEFDTAREAWSWVDKERSRWERKGFLHAHSLGLSL